MINRLKRRLALLVATTLIAGSCTVAYADEVPAEIAAVEEEAVIQAAEETAELQDASTTVSDPSADPTTWSKDPKYARYTYLMYLPRFSNCGDADIYESDMISNGEKIKRAAVSGDDLPIYRGISFNCLKVEDDIYVIYAYGIHGGEFEGYIGEASANTVMASSNGSGLDAANKPAGVFDYSAFTWYGKSGGSKKNGKIMYDAAVIQWKSGQKAKKQRLFEVKDLKYKNNKWATVSFCSSTDGKWIKLKNNAYQKTSKQPSFYPVMKLKKSYRDVDGTKVKADSDARKLLKKVNKKLKSNKIEFEIRRRPIAGTVSDDYIDVDNSRSYDYSEFASLVGDDLDFTSSGKLKKATLQFKSETYTVEKNYDADDFKSSDSTDSEAKTTKSQSLGYRVTHVLKKNKLKSSDASNADIGKKIKNGEFKKKTKTDAWYTTKKIGGFDTLIVYGANNLEGVAAFRKRSDKTIGSGYYNNDKDCFILSVD